MAQTEPEPANKYNQQAYLMSVSKENPNIFSYPHPNKFKLFEQN